MLAEQIAKMSLVVISVQFREEKKRCAVLSNYKADVYEAWQLWLQRNGI